ncbi:MAG: Gx transporter family protein [Chitinivibrionia bacterium]|nr:Gx transporter family protein [Chitinivibrionia bacterium]
MLIDRQNEKAALFVMAFLLAGIERFFPVIPVLPWLKIGLFHAVVMVWIYRYGLIDALAFVFIRQWVIMAFFGFAILPFVLGTSGTVVSVILGAALIKSRKFGAIAIGIFCAIVHNIVQLFVLYHIMGGNFVWQWQLPIMLAVSLFTGAITGFLAVKINGISFNDNVGAYCIRSKNDMQCKKNDNDNIGDRAYAIRPYGIAVLIVVIATTFIFENYIFYAAIFLAGLIVSKFINCRLLGAVEFVKRYGIFIVALFISSAFYNYQGALHHTAKISLWFFLTPFFQKSGFYQLFYGALTKIFPQKYSETLSIGAIMPQVFPSVLEEIPSIIKSVFKKPKSAAEILARKTSELLAQWGKN